MRLSGPVRAKQPLRLALLGAAAIGLFAALLFFSPDSLTLSVPAGPNAPQIWSSRAQIALKVLLGAAAIGLGNFLTQMFTRNRLADAAVLGVNVFQQLAVALLIFCATDFFVASEQSYQFALIYAATGILSGFCFYGVSLKTNLGSRLILIYGILLNVSVTAAVYFVMTSGAINPDVVKIRFSYYQDKVFGGVRLAQDSSNLYVCAGTVAACAAATFALRHRIVAQATTPLKVVTLGARPKSVNLAIVTLICVLGSAAFSLIGVIAFVGVAVSFAAGRAFSRFGHRACGSILFAAVLLLASQWIQTGVSHFAAPIPLSVVAGLVGSLVFVGSVLAG